MTAALLVVFGAAQLIRRPSLGNPPLVPATLLQAHVQVPADIAAALPPERPLRVIVLVPDTSEDQAWDRLAAEQFLRGYAESDAIYDELPAG